MSEHQQMQKPGKPDFTFQKQTALTSRNPVSHPASIIQRARINPKSLTAADVLQLQRTIGNRAVGRLLSEIRNSSKVQHVPIQRQEVPEEEKEPLQGMFGKEPKEETCPSCVQKQEKPEEEEPIQGKFETIQRQELEDEEKLQMKSVVQRQEISEEDKSIQGKMIGTIQHQEIPEEEPLQKKSENNTGMPDNLKDGVESLSGIDMSDVRVHYNSSKPAEVGALAYTQGTNIHVAPEQERHLPHEAWHVVQQAQGRVKPTMQLKDGVPVNDDQGLEHEADVMGTKALRMLCPHQIVMGPSNGTMTAEQREAEQTEPSEIPCEVSGVSGRKVRLNFISTMSANSTMQQEVDSKAIQKKHKLPPTVQITAKTTGNIPIQCKGVKSELMAADANIEALANESNKSRDLMNSVGDAIYEAYKPANPGQFPVSTNWDTKNRDKSRGSLKEEFARDGARRINHWAHTANESATRILEELTGIANVANVNLSSIKMGMNTDTEPDAAAINQAGYEFALESKYVTSPQQGAVDKHLVAASSQLQKRYDYQKQKITKTNFNIFIAHIRIQNENNTWPYTPKAYEKSKQTGFKDLLVVMKNRLENYKGKSTASIPILYRITFPTQHIVEQPVN